LPDSLERELLERFRVPIRIVRFVFLGRIAERTPSKDQRIFFRCEVDISRLLVEEKVVSLAVHNVEQNRLQEVSQCGLLASSNQALKPRNAGLIEDLDELEKMWLVCDETGKSVTGAGKTYWDLIFLDLLQDVLDSARTKRRVGSNVELYERHDGCCQ